MRKVLFACLVCTSTLLLALQQHPPIGQPYSKRTNQAQQSTSEQNRTQQPPTINHKIGPAQSENEARNSTQKQDENTEINRRIMLFTGVLAFVAFLQWGATMLQWNAMKRQSKFMLRGLAVSRFSARAAKRAADAATAANEHAADAFRINARPWVGIIEVNVGPFEPKDGEPDIEITAKIKCQNFGNGPAIQVRAISGMSCQKDEITEEAIDKQLSAATDVSEFIIMPSEVAGGGSAPCSLKLTPKHCAFLNAGALRLYYFGRIEYRDIFNYRHSTRFCALYNPQRGVFQYYGKYNDAN